MAFIKLQKLKSGVVGSKGYGTHFDLDRREQRSHSNKNIDPALSHQNYYIGSTSWEQIRSNLKGRQEELDQKNPPKRVRADRVTAMTAWIVCPQALEGRQEEFFRDAYAYMQGWAGKENIAGAEVHLDEKHTYIDHGQQQKESLHHMHVFITPGTEEKGLNAKAFTSQMRLKALQRGFNDFCKEKYGVEYQTGEYDGRKRSVEQLKEESLDNALDVIERSREEGARLAGVMITKRHMLDEIEALQEKANNLHQDLEKASQEYLKFQDEVSRIEDMLGFAKHKGEHKDWKSSLSMANNTLKELQGLIGSKREELQQVETILKSKIDAAGGPRALDDLQKEALLNKTFKNLDYHDTSNIIDKLNLQTIKEEPQKTKQIERKSLDELLHH